MKQITIAILALLLVAMTAVGQTTDSAVEDKFFILSEAGWGPDTGARGEGAVGVRITDNVYSLTTMNLAGGVGAVVEDLLSKLATRRGVTLWGRAGAGATSTNVADGTDYSMTFGGGIMLTYDLSQLNEKLEGFEAVATVKAMYTQYAAEDGTTSTAVRPQYLGGIKFSWQD